MVEDNKKPKRIKTDISMSKNKLTVYIKFKNDVK